MLCISLVAFKTICNFFTNIVAFLYRLFIAYRPYTMSIFFFLLLQCWLKFSRFVAMGVEYVGDAGNVSPAFLIKRKFVPHTFSRKCVHIEVFMSQCQ